MLYFSSPWLFCNCQSVPFYPFTFFTQSPNTFPLWRPSVCSQYLWVKTVILYKRKLYAETWLNKRTQQTVPAGRKINTLWQKRSEGEMHYCSCLWVDEMYGQRGDITHVKAACAMCVCLEIKKKWQQFESGSRRKDQ